MQKVTYLTAVVVSTNSEFDTMEFTGIEPCPDDKDIPIFYHCNKDSVLRDNGALEGASGAFAKDDEVIVQCEIVDEVTYKPLYVLGFMDKPKRCNFRFKIIRDDGVVIDETTLACDKVSITEAGKVAGNLGIILYRKRLEYPEPTAPWLLEFMGSAHGQDPENYPEDLPYWTKVGDVWYYEKDSAYNPGVGHIVKFSYNTVTQIWNVPFYGWKDKDDRDEGKYFVSFLYSDGVETWYKTPVDIERPEYVYKLADRFKDEDMTAPGLYEIAVPYYFVTYENNNTDHPSLDGSVPGYDGYVDTWDCDEQVAKLLSVPGGCRFAHVIGSESNYTIIDTYYFDLQDYFYKKVTVKSSIEYRITEQLGGFIDGTVKGCQFGYVIDDEGIWFCNCNPISLTIGAQTLGGVYQTGDNISGREEGSFIVIPPVPYEVVENEHTVSVSISALPTDYTFVRYRDFRQSFDQAVYISSSIAVI